MARLMDRGTALLFRHRRFTALALYGCVAAAAYLGAYLLRFDLRIPRDHLGVLAATMPVLVVIRLVCSHFFNLTQTRWRFVSTTDVIRLGASTAVGSVGFSAVTVILPLAPAVPLAVLLAESLLTVLGTTGLWIVYRTSFERIRHHRSGFNGHRTRVLIVGAGEAGNLLAGEMLRFPTGYLPLAFVDDDSQKIGARIQGLEVTGPTADLAEIAVRYGVRDVIIAVPSASPAQLRELVERCEQVGLNFKVLPGIAEVLAGHPSVSNVREVRIEDLLGREPITLELPELAADVRGQCVLVTGAAGSIGSELARQLALHGPRKLLLFDQSETSLFYLELELKDRHPGLEIVPIIGDMVDTGTIESVFDEHQPDRIFHAAAYKHVPMMETNPREAIRNNVIGAVRVADAAGRSRAGTFVLVSTDKAVQPVSVMGATKRLAEMLVLEMQDRYPETKFSAVRFGNVLGSSGSVIPIFKRQLAAGKPLTITHPDATRYFMTIQEAVQLILKASVLAELRGRIAMLEMGEPIRIVDLARTLIRLSGIKRNGSESIRFTGLRPGERLHERLVAPEEATLRTSLPKVRIVQAQTPVSLDLVSIFQDCERIVDNSSNMDALGTLQSVFAGVRDQQAASIALAESDS